MYMQRSRLEKVKIASIQKNKYESDVSKANFQSHSNNPLDLTVAKDSVSFGGAAEGFKKASTGVFKFIDRAGFLVEFIILDALSMILPRIAVGLNRDRDKTGKWNYKAGAEEAGREIMSGPTMQIIPLAILTGVSALKPSSHMERSTLSTLTSNMKCVVEKSSSLSDKSKLDRSLAEEIFENAYKGRDVDKNLKEKFIELLSKSSNCKKKLFNNEVYKNNEAEFVGLVSKINNKLSTEVGSLSPENLELFDTVIENGVKNKSKLPLSISSGDLYKDFGNYSRDIITKLSKCNFSENIVSKAQTQLETIKKSRLNLKVATAISAFFAVGGFLLYLPKLYQKGSVSPAEESARRARESVANGGANENK